MRFTSTVQPSLHTDDFQIIGSTTNGATGIFADNFSYSQDETTLIVENINAPGFSISIQGMDIRRLTIQHIEGRGLERGNHGNIPVNDIQIRVLRENTLRFDSLQHPEFWMEITFLLV